MWGFLVHEAQRLLGENAKERAGDRARARDVECDIHSDEGVVIGVPSNEITDRLILIDEGVTEKSEPLSVPSPVISATLHSSTKDLLHAKLHQKVLELRTGDAFINPKSWRGKLRSWWMNNVSTATAERMDQWIPFAISLLFMIVLGGLALNEGILAIPLLSLIIGTLLLFFTVVKQLHGYGPNKTHTAKNLARLLQLDPSTKPMIGELEQHLQDPNISRKWWNNVDDILIDMIENLKPKTPSITDEEYLKEMLNKKSDETISINSDQNQASESTNRTSLRI